MGLVVAVVVTARQVEWMAKGLLEGTAMGVVVWGAAAMAAVETVQGWSEAVATA